MKTIRNLSLIAAGAAIGWLIVSQGDLLAAQKKETATASPAVGHLVVKRAANLGATIVGLKVDGKEVDRITYNRSYSASIPAGSHVLTSYPVNSYENARPVDMRITVAPGKTYTFTAKRNDIEVVLR
jgi:hypothetical protein